MVDFPLGTAPSHKARRGCAPYKSNPLGPLRTPENLANRTIHVADLGSNCGG